MDLRPGLWRGQIKYLLAKAGRILCICPGLAPFRPAVLKRPDLEQPMSGDPARPDLAHLRTACGCG